MAEQQINSQIQTNNEELTNTITLHDIIRMVIANWYWFVLSTVCCLCAAYYYLASTPKIYSRTATILVKDSRKGGDVDLTAFSDLAGFQNRRNVDNEVFILQSRRLMTNVVKQLNLTVNYSVSERLRRRDLYGQAPMVTNWSSNPLNRILSSSIGVISIASDWLSLSASAAASSRRLTATRSRPPWVRSWCRSRSTWPPTTSGFRSA